MNRPRTRDKHLPRNVYHRHGAYYFVRRGTWTRLGSDLREALAKYASLYESKAGSMPALIADALPIITRSVKPNTAAQYRVAGKKLAKIFTEFEPVQVTHGDVVRMMDLLAPTPNMANRCLTVLRLVFKYAVEREIVDGNPTIGTDRHVEQKRKRLISIGEITAIYRAAGPRLRVIIDLALRTGQRIGDVLRIHRADLQAEGIAFTQQKTGTKVIVLWNPELREVVECAKTLNQNIRAMTLLHNRRGKTPDYSTVKLQWTKACLAAGVADAHLHDLRAMSATWAQRQGKDATALLGHSSASQTVRYLRDRESTVAEGTSFGQSKGLLDNGG